MLASSWDGDDQASPLAAYLHEKKSPGPEKEADVLDADSIDLHSQLYNPHIPPFQLVPGLAPAR
jgi:ABC-type Fe3+ transport system substrate-binding protein